jgi:N utilization substance protein B
VNGSPLSISRREDRESALAFLYEADMTGDDIDDVIARRFADDEEYGTQLVLGIAETCDDLDERVNAVADDWAIDRMAGIDRAILRMGVWELLHSASVPVSAVVSEAVALANQYSTEKSAPFINGILVKIASGVRSDDA